MREIKFRAWDKALQKMWAKALQRKDMLEAEHEAVHRYFWGAGVTKFDVMEAHKAVEEVE